MKYSIKSSMLLATFVMLFAIGVDASPINCATAPSAGVCAPTLSMTYQVGNGAVQNIFSTGSPIFTGGNWNVNLTPQTLGSVLFTGGQLVANADPFVGFSVGVINNTTGTMTFSYDFVTPYSGGTYGYVQSVFADVLIDTLFQGTSKVTPVGGAYIMNTYDTGSHLTQVNLGLGCTTVNFVCVSPDSGAIGPLLYTSLVSGTLEVKGSFTLTKGSQYTLTGRSALLPLPEPGTLVLFGSSLIGLAGIARRRMTK